MRWFNGVFYGLLILAVAITLVLLVFEDAVGAAVTGVTLIGTAALIWLILPRRYEVWRDRLELVFPAWRWRIAFESIEVVREARPFEAYAFLGVRFATAPSQTVTVLRHNANMLRRPNLVISPEDRETFLRHLQRAMRELILSG